MQKQEQVKSVGEGVEHRRGVESKEGKQSQRGMNRKRLRNNINLIFKFPNNVTTNHHDNNLYSLTLFQLHKHVQKSLNKIKRLYILPRN